MVYAIGTTNRHINPCLCLHMAFIQIVFLDFNLPLVMLLVFVWGQEMFAIGFGCGGLT